MTSCHSSGRAIEAGQPKPKGRWELATRLWIETKGFRGHVAGLFLISAIGMCFTLLSPIPLKLVIDSVLGNRPLPAEVEALLPARVAIEREWLLGILALTVVLIAAAKQLADLGYSWLRTFTGEKLVLNFRSKLFRQTQNLSLSYHDTLGPADSTYRIQYDAPAIQWLAVDAMIPIATAFLTLLAMIVVLASINSMIALVALGVVPVLFALSQLYSRKLKVRWRDTKNLESSTMGIVQEVLSAVRVVKAFAQEEREQNRYEQQAGRTLREQLRLTLTGGSFTVLVGVLTAFGTAVVLFLGARQVQSGAMTLGQFILVMNYLALLYGPIQTLSKSVASIQGSLVSFERALALLDQRPEVTEHANALPLTRAHGQIVFRNVSFAYQPDRQALRDVSFAIRPNSRVGITGPTGAGKSTLVSLLLRMYDPVHGEILLDGLDLREYRLRDLRRQFAIVLQEPVLFSTSIAENIAYARPDASFEDIVRAALAANADEFIRRLPRQYETPVGDRGVQLSGGERQRISLARAFLKNAPILILDEPTSAVDLETEAVILEAMERLLDGRTSFMIAHRLSTLDLCNLRIHLERGRLVSLIEGTHSQPERLVSR
jgi:ATP-binding cassette, subfamily B, bacterial